MRNMRTPVGVAVEMDWGRGARIATAAGAIIVLLGVIYLLKNPLQSDIAYRQGRDLIAMGNATEGELMIQVALKIDPNHHDCRSFYSLWLLNRGRNAEALEQLMRVRERLSASEVEARLGVAAWRLGNAELAREYWRRYLDVRPIFSPGIPLEQQAQFFEQQIQ
jgi:tetratricopeptide (TPR) repeat protein